MTIIGGAHSTPLLVSAAFLGLAFGAAGCGGETKSETAGNGSPAPVVGETDDRLQLTEGVSYKLPSKADDEGATSVRLTARKDGDEPIVVISVSGGEDGGQDHALSLGETLDLGGELWRVSEIGMSDSRSQPGSATLIRDET